MKKNLITAVLMTLVTTVLFGLLFPLLITGLAQALFPRQANGDLVMRNGTAGGVAVDRPVILFFGLFPLTSVQRRYGV